MYVFLCSKYLKACIARLHGKAILLIKFYQYGNCIRFSLYLCNLI